MNGKIVEIEETNTPPPRTPDSDSSRFFTQQGGSSATMQQVPSAPRPQGSIIPCRKKLSEEFINSLFARRRRGKFHRRTLSRNERFGARDQSVAWNLSDCGYCVPLWPGRISYCWRGLLFQSTTAAAAAGFPSARFGPRGRKKKLTQVISFHYHVYSEPRISTKPANSRS